MGESAQSPPASSGLGQIELDTEILQSYCGGALAQLVEDLDGLWREFGSVPVHAGLFGFSDVGEAMTEQHRAVQQIFDETVRGTRDDVQGLQDRLRAQLKDYKDADDAAAQALQRLSRDATTSESAADRAFRDAVLARTGPAETAPAAAAPAVAPAAAQTNAGGAIE